MELDLEEIWDYLVEMEIATEEELKLITDINGYNEETLNDVIYARSGYHDLEQYTEYEDKEFYREHFLEDDDEDEEEDE